MEHCSEDYRYTACVGWPIDESEDDSEWEDVEEEMEGIVTDDNGTIAPDLPDSPPPQHLALALLCDKNLHHKVRKVTTCRQCIL